MRLRFGILIGTMVLLSIVASSQTPPAPVDPKSKEAFRELFKEIRDWAQTNVIPKMQEWKTKLDNTMSQDDLQSLNALRERASKLKADGKALAKDMKAARRAKDRTKLKLYKEKTRLLKEERVQLLKELKPIALAYKSTLVEIGKDAQPFKKEWRDGFKNIVRGWYDENKGDLGRGGKRALVRALQRLKKLNGIEGDLRARINAARFMLWDGRDLPEVPELSEESGTKAEDLTTDTPDGYSLNANYPNPFNPSTRISFAIPQPGHVTLVVYDALGREVARLIDSNLGVGSHSATFDGRGLASGLYVYKIHAGQFVQERKMQLVK